MKIGIIGGVSPFAFSQFYNELCYNYRQDTNEYPEILIYSINVSEETEKYFLTNDVNEKIRKEIHDKLLKGCEIFKQNNVELVTICCNTLSDIFYEIASTFKFKKIITPLSATIEYINDSKFQNILLLATGYTNGEKLHNCDSNIIKINSKDQKKLEEFILNKINNKINTFDLDDVIETYIKEYKVDSIILGCTDINISDIHLEENIEVIDSVKMMLKQCNEFLREICAE